MKVRFALNLKGWHDGYSLLTAFQRLRIDDQPPEYSNLNFHWVDQATRTTIDNLASRTNYYRCPAGEAFYVTIRRESTPYFCRSRKYKHIVLCFEGFRSKESARILLRKMMMELIKQLND